MILNIITQYLYIFHIFLYNRYIRLSLPLVTYQSPSFLEIHIEIMFNPQGGAPATRCRISQYLL